MKTKSFPLLKFLFAGCLLAVSGGPGLLAESNATALAPKIAAGNAHSLFIKADGSLWAVGQNNKGQLGTGDVNSRATPVKVVDGGVSAVSAGVEHSLFVKEDGTLWGMGSNERGAIGTGNADDVHVPVQILDGVKDVASFNHHTLILKNDGSLWSTGNNYLGQLGVGGAGGASDKFSDPFDKRAPVQVVGDGVRSIAVGESNSFFIKDDGSLWGFGSNGLLGNLAMVSQVDFLILILRIKERL